METFTLSDERFNLHLERPDAIRQTFTFWSHRNTFDSFPMESPCPQGTQHLPMEAFTLAPHELESSISRCPPVGSHAPCTKSVYKAAHRRSRVATKVSPSEPSLLMAIANPALAKPICFYSFCDFHTHSSPTPDLRQRMTLKGFTGKGLNKIAHALNGNHFSWQISVPRYRSKLRKDSFRIPNGMIVFISLSMGKINYGSNTIDEA